MQNSILKELSHIRPLIHCLPPQEADGLRVTFFVREFIKIKTPGRCDTSCSFKLTISPTLIKKPDYFGLLNVNCGIMNIDLCKGRCSLWEIKAQKTRKKRRKKLKRKTKQWQYKRHRHQLPNKIKSELKNVYLKNDKIPKALSLRSILLPIPTTANTDSQT
jgi:hypothetical protein